MTNTEKMDRGLLWGDTDEYLEEQARAKDLMYEFNMSRPNDVEKRAKLIPQIFNVQGEVFIQQPITLARGKTVTIGNGTWINSGLTLWIPAPSSLTAWIFPACVSISGLPSSAGFSRTP